VAEAPNAKYTEKSGSRMDLLNFDALGASLYYLLSLSRFF